MASRTAELALECKRLSESCLYSSTALFIWLRFVRYVRAAFVVLPLVLGSLASWRLLTDSNIAGVKVFSAACAFIAGLLPAVYSALKFDDHLDVASHLAGEFKNLQDRFRQVALVSSRKPFSEFEADVKPLIDRLEQARAGSFTAPEWCFKRAQKKITKGDYDFDIDVRELDTKA